MPRKPTNPAQSFFDEFDARSYRHLVPREPEVQGQHVPAQPPQAQLPPNPTVSLTQTLSQSASSGKKRKKQKQKSHKKAKEKSDRHIQLDIRAPILLEKSKSIVAYDDISSDSDISNNGPPSPVNRVHSNNNNSRESAKRSMSPGVTARGYGFEGSPSNSPVNLREPPSPPPRPPVRSTSRKHPKKRPLPTADHHIVPKEHSSKNYSSGSSAGPPPKHYNPPPKAYNPPKAYADPPRAYSGSYNRDHSPTEIPRKRYRSRSPSPSYMSRKKNR